MSLIAHLIKELLADQEEPILATPEDAAYFRTLATRLPKQGPKEAKAPPALPRPHRSPPLLPSPPVQPPQAAETLAVEKRSEPDQTPPPLPRKESPPPPRSPAAEQTGAAEEAPKEWSHLRALLHKVAPTLSWVEQIPSDHEAKRIADRWKTKGQSAPLSILVFQEPPAHRALLGAIADALDAHFGPARLVSAEQIEAEKRWDQFLSADGLKWIVVCDYTLWQLHALMAYYTEIPAQHVRKLGNIPVFLLPDLSLYLKDPQLKRSLWKALCQKLGPAS